MMYVNCKRCDKKIKRTRAVKRYAPDWNGGKPWVWYLCGEHHRIKNPIEAFYGDKIKYFKPIMDTPPVEHAIGKSYLDPVELKIEDINV